MWDSIRKYIGIVAGFITVILYALLQKEKKEQAEFKQSIVEEESEALNRQSEALHAQQVETKEKMNEARNKDFSPDDINGMFK